MRLFQLARKLEIPPESIVSLLANQGVTIENRSNFKLDENHVALVEAQFKAEEVEMTEAAITPEEPIQENTEDFETIIEAKPEEVAETIPQDSTLLSIQPVEEAEPNNSEEEEGKEEEDKNGEEAAVEAEPEAEEEKEIEVIRVKKIKLSGPKVVGKIELPEPVKKEPTGTGSDDPNESDDPRQKRYQGRRQFEKRHKRTATPEELRQREARRKAKEKKENEKRKKANRKQFYVENIQTSSTAKPKSKKKRKVNPSKNPEVQPPSHQKAAVKHKNPIKRFWAWLNGAYDRY